MNLEDYRTLFIVGTLGLALVAAFPAVGVVLPQGGSERFSEFLLLGPGHMAEGYPFNVGVGEVYGVFVGVGNHMGGSEYYMVQVKFRNSTQSLPDVDGFVASSLPPLFEFRFFVDGGEVWEVSVSFGFEDVFVEGDVLFVGNVIIDGVSFPVDASAVWDVEAGGFLFQLFFELWRYDVISESFRFDDRYVGIWLNMTGS
jgi:hypothetical protein